MLTATHVQRSVIASYNGSSRLVASGLLAAAAACTPVTTRPDFFPFPEAPISILDARPERVTRELAALVPAESLRIERVNARDGYLETAWYDAKTGRSYAGARDLPHLASAVKIRCWADPYVPGQTRLTVEAVYRPRFDPSRPERDLEVMVPKDHPGTEIAARLIENVKQKVGVPKAAR
jgi:hypothetical protein